MILDAEIYGQAKEIFHKALPLNQEQRRQFLERECQGRQDIRAEVESLLRYHDGQSPRQQSPYTAVNIAFETTKVSRFQQEFRRLLQNRAARLALLAGITLILLILAKQGRDRLIEAMQREISGHLQTVINSNFLTLDLWAEHRFSEVERWANILSRSPELRDLLHMARTSESPQGALTQAAQQEEIRRILEPALRNGAFLHYAIIDANYRNISTDLSAMIGKKILPNTDLMLVLDRIANGERTLVPRRLVGTAIRDSEVLQKQEYVSWFGVPVRDESGRVIVTLSLAVDAKQHFDRILRVGRWGNSGEIYAFDANAMMLSESRFLDQLVEVGVLKRGQPSGLNVALRDPGGNLTQGYRPTDSHENWPLMQIASRALDGLRKTPAILEGNVLQPYRDYRGMDVIGAWRWHPALGFGLIAEVDAREALYIQRFVDALYTTLMLLFIVVSGFAIITSFALVRLRPAAILGSRLGQYRLLRKVSEGGIGEIYLAQHEFLKRPTAIKILKCDYFDPESIARFEAEVRATSQLSHPNTVAVYDFGRLVNNRVYYAMEYLPGISLARLIEIETRLPCHRTVHLLLQICGSLHEAHSLGLIHRDIKPLNIMICRIGGEYDVVKVVDFGLVRSIKSLMPSEALEALSRQLRGTPAYIAPELLADPLAASVSSDIYSLGVVTYKMLSGRNPFDATHEGALLYDILHAEPQSLGELRPDLPEKLVNLVTQCLAKDPRARPASVEIIHQELTAIPGFSAWTQKDARQWWGLRDHLLIPADS